MSSPLISVVIPTRERCSTLRHAIRSCVVQEFPDAEFIVSNNASTDDTEAVVREFTDSRIRLVNPGRRVSMHENYEFALSHARGQYVLYIGDDDAVMPSALNELARLAIQEKPVAVKWQTPLYVWPHIADPNAAGRIAFTPGSAGAHIPGQVALSAFKWALITFRYLPMVYHGMVSMDAINRIRQKTGEFFRCENPDVYSGAAIAATTREYLYTSVPLTINGTSAFSIGSAAIQVQAQSTGSPAPNPFEQWRAERTLEPHPDFVDVGEVPSVHGYITDVLLRVRDYCLDGKLSIPLRYRLMATVRELMGRSDWPPEAANNPLRKFCREHGQLWLHDFYARVFEGRALLVQPDQFWRRRLRHAGTAVLDTREFGAQDVCDAATLLGKLIGPPHLSFFEPAPSLMSILRARVLNAIGQRTHDSLGLKVVQDPALQVRVQRAPRPLSGDANLPSEVS